MLIAHIEPPSPHRMGDQVYRTVQPCHALAELDGVHVISGSWLSPIMHQAARSADVLLLCQAVDADFLPVLAERSLHGLPTVVEINDHFTSPQPWNDVSCFYTHPINQSLVLQLAHQASALQLSSAGLQRRFAHLNDSYAVFPNQLWSVGALAAHPTTPLRLGWAGSFGHRDDIKWVLPVLQALLESRRNVELAIMAPTALHRLFDWVPRNRLDLQPTADLPQYREFLRTLHIGIAPLQPSEFNQGRSDIKFLEYAQAGVAAVCSSLEPYAQSVRHGEDGLLFSNLDELRTHLDTLIAQPELRLRLAHTAHARVQAERLEQHHAPGRLRWYQEITAGMEPPRQNAARRFALLHEQNSTPADEPHPRCLQLRFGDAESCLYNGLLPATESSLALADMRRAAALQPGFYLPLLYLGQKHADTNEARGILEQAARLAPRSVLVPYVLGERNLAAADTAGALRAWHTCIRIAPDFAPAHEALARVALQNKDDSAAILHLRAAVQANAFYRVPAARLATLHLQHDNPAAARELLQDSLRLGNSTWLEHQLLGDVYSRERNWRRAAEHLETALRSTPPDPRPIRALLARVYLAQGYIQQARNVLSG